MDRDKDIKEIFYNHLNLPTKIYFRNGGEIEYIYDASGVKIKKEVKDGSDTNTTEYYDGFQYRNNLLEFFPHAEGYVKATRQSRSGYDFKYVFNYTDHLGNIRVRYIQHPVTGDLEILQEDHYYPFGLKHEGYNTRSQIFMPRDELITLVPATLTAGDSYKYKFQGQEHQDEFGLNWDSFKWRNYDPAMGRFMSIDPLTEEYNIWSPYAFSGNRVVDARELEGLEPHSVHTTLDDAATNFGEQYNGISIRSRREAGTLFYSSIDNNGNKIYSYTIPILGTAGFVNPNDAEPIPDGTVQVGDGHTHANDRNIEARGVKNGIETGDNFPTTEGGDLDQSDKNSKTNPNFEADYTITPNGTLYKYIPTGKKGENRKKDVKKVGRATNIPSDPKSRTRTNKVNPDKTPDILPINIDDDEF